MLTAICVLYDGEWLLFVFICIFRFQFCFLGGCASVCVCLYVHFVQRLGTCMLASVLKCVELNQCLFIYFGILIL